MVVPFFDTSTFFKIIGFGGFDFRKTPQHALARENLSDQLDFKCSIQNSGWNP
jgi:hypothetical protein